jgi:penicillin-binding protein 1A
MVPTPTLIRRVETADGELLFSGGSGQQRAVSEATAFLMSNMLAEVINAGTATAARRAGFTLPAAGKTGTTNEYRDAWFVGYTPTLVTGVWVGYDMPRTIIANGYAAQLAVPIWGRFMKAATRGEKPAWFKAPPMVTSVTICRLSGKLATDSCRYVARLDADGFVSMESQAYTEFFVRGTEPSTYCTGHGESESADWRFASAIGRSEPRAVVGTSGVETRPAVVTGGSAPAPAADVALPSSPAPPNVGAAATPADTPAQTEAPPTATPAQRRGFWSRVFRRGQETSQPTTQQPSP